MIQRVLHVSRHEEVILCVLSARCSTFYEKFCARRRGRFASVALVIAVLIRPLANGSKMGP